MTGSVAPTTSPTTAPSSDTSATSGPTGSTNSSDSSSGVDESSNGSTNPAQSSEPPESTTEPDPGASGDPVPSAGCGKTRTLQNGEHMIQSGGTSRTYHIKAPDNYDNTRPYRVIFMFHWNYGSINAIVRPPDADRNTDDPYYGLQEMAGDSSIFVVPQGLRSPTGGDGWENPNNRDVNFTDDMLTAVSNDLCIDTSRVFTTGFSYGGSMSYKLACARSDKFRAAVVYNPGALSGQTQAECANPIAFFQSHGLDDQILSYNAQGLPILNTFVRVNGCTAMTPPTPARDEHQCVSYEGCMPGYPVRFCNFGAGQNNPHGTVAGHYPSAKDPGQSKSWIPVEAWEFISQF